MCLGSVLKKAAVLRKCVEEGECVVNQVHPIPGTGVTRNEEVPLEVTAVPSTTTTEGPMWGHPMPVLGALSPFLEPFCGHLSPKLDKVY